jgi:signal transduction histidine kinase
LAENPELARRLEATIADLDDTNRQVRSTIFSLEQPSGDEPGIRARMLEVCAEAARSLGFEPEVRFAGPIEDRVADSMGSELLATLREALSNVARHAKARRVEVRLSVDDDLHLCVADDGVGVDPDRRSFGKGLPNMAERAEALGGSFTLRHRAGGGSEVSWRVPLG